MPTRPNSHTPKKTKPAKTGRLRGYERGNADPFYCSKRWRRARAAFLSSNALCSRCLAKGITKAASEVHHIKPRADRPDLELDMSNLEALCKPCHSSETLTAINTRRRGKTTQTTTPRQGRGCQKT